jgi:hypothetical protein
MGVTQFDPPRIDDSGNLWVSGPFKPEGATIRGQVLVPFMIIQYPADQAGQPPADADFQLAQGLGMCDPSKPDEHGDLTWKGVVDASHFNRADWDLTRPVRGIGAAIVVRDTNEVLPPDPGDPKNPPVIEVITWCMTKMWDTATSGAAPGASS